MSRHIVKLAVGVTDIHHLCDIQRRHEIDYKGQRAVPCWTRYQPKEADAILEHGRSIYRVVQNFIICRHKILGFEKVETEEKGMMCMIMQDAQMIETVPLPKRAFQGWRYLKPEDAPEDRGIYIGGGSTVQDQDSKELECQLRQAGLL